MVIKLAKKGMKTRTKNNKTSGKWRIEIIKKKKMILRTNKRERNTVRKEERNKKETMKE